MSDVMKLEDVFIITTGYIRSRVKEDDNSIDTLVYTKEYFDSDMKYNSFKNKIDDDYIKLDPNKYPVTNEGDIIVDSLSQKAAVVKKEHEGMFVAFNYFILRPKIKINKDYFVSWFNLSNEVKNQLNITLQGTIIKKLTLRQLKELEITMPNKEKQLLLGSLYKESNKKLNIQQKIHLNEMDIIKKILGDINE